MKKKAYKDIDVARKSILSKFPNTTPEELQKLELVYMYLPQYIKRLAVGNGSKVPPLNNVLQAVKQAYNINVYMLQDLIANYYQAHSLVPGTPIKTAKQSNQRSRISSREK